ncbi:MAG: GNAT family N-acetyltransferase [Campylobacter sp.]|nr:GNAT family N-acetyltransferase [Campylobacter sp.]
MITLRKANKLDILAILKIEEESFNEFKLSRASIAYHIRRNFMIVAEDERGILGYVLVFDYLKIPRIYSIAVSQKARNLGVGSVILRYLTKEFKALRLEVRSDNYKAISLYEKFGFKSSKILPKYYEDCDGLEMKFSKTSSL